MEFHPEYYPEFRWTAGAIDCFHLGFKRCSQCKQTKSLEEFSLRRNMKEKTKFLNPSCHNCRRERCRNHPTKQATPENRKKWREYQQKRWNGNREHCQTLARKNRAKRKEENREWMGQYRKEKKAEQEAEILSRKCCDVCGNTNANHFWRNTSGGVYDEFLVLHHWCSDKAKEKGWLTRFAKVRHKDELRGE